MGQMISRRRFLAWLAAAPVAMAACRSGIRQGVSPTRTPTAMPSPTPPPLTFFEALEALRRAVRASPDHRLARAEALVAARDAEGIVRFVREAIAVYPAGENSIGDAIAGWRWGTRGTLRGGTGTPREVAELLAELLQRAGFQAEVVEMPLSEPQAAADVLRRAKPTPFEPALDDATFAAVQRALNLPPPEPLQPADPEGRESAALAEDVLRALGDEAGPSAPFDLEERLFSLPGVQVQLRGQPYLANLWASEGPLFLPLDRELGPAPAHPPALSVTVRLEAAHRHTPAKRFVLVERTWSAEELAGRQVEIAFVPPARTLDEVIGNSQSSVRARRLMFAPILAVRGPDLDAEAARALSVVGDPFTVTGQVLREQGEGLAVNGQPLPPARPPGKSPVIASADLALNAAAFPLVALEVTPKDAQGNVIENLSAAHFLIEEDGQPVQALMERWARPAPRVLLLLDDSDSIPAAFRAEGAQALVQTLAGQIQAADPRAQFLVAKIYEGTAYVGFSEWTGNPQDLVAQVREVGGYGSRLWEALADAGRHDPTVIVMITDGQAVNAADERLTEPPPDLAAMVRAGPPAVIIGVGEVDAAMLEHLGQAGRMGAFPAGTPEEALQAILQALNANPLPPYRLTYHAPEGENAPRTVRLFERYGSSDRPQKALRAEARYTPPPPAERAEPPGLSGLFLTVQVGGRTITRVLGGLAASLPDERPTPEHIADVRRALHGRMTLAFEAGAPSLAQLLDDRYTALLAMRPVLEARDPDELREALATTPLYLPPPDLHIADVPLPDDPSEPITFEMGLRVTLHRVLPAEMPDGQPAAARWLDLLPLAEFRTADADPARAFRLTARRTARLSLAEALAFPDHNTVKAVRGKTLRVARYDYQIAEVLQAAGASEATVRRAREVFGPWAESGHIVLLPEDGTPAGWALSAHGAVWGVLGGEGSKTAGGGGGFSPAKILDWAQLAGSLMVIAGLGGFSFAGGVWLAFSSALYKKLESATAVIAQLPVSPDDPAPDLRQAEKVASFGDVACALVQALVLEGAAPTGRRLFHERLAKAIERLAASVSAVDAALSLATGGGLFCK